MNYEIINLIEKLIARTIFSRKILWQRVHNTNIFCSRCLFAQTY